MKFIRRFKNFFSTVYETAKSVSKGKLDFCAIAIDYIYCVLRFKVTEDEYLKYEFYNCSNRYRKQFFLINHRKKLINVNQRFFTISKYVFYNRIPDLFNRKIILVPHCGEKAFIDFAKEFKKIIIKPDTGSLGSGIKFFSFTDEESAKKQFAEFSMSAPCVCEEIICQHPAMNDLNPHSVNTVRIVSILKDGEVDIVSATLRIGATNDSVVDNMLSGGIGAGVDISTGIVSTMAIDYAFNKYSHHPLTGAQIIGFQIPNWNCAIDLVKSAHKRIPNCLLYGWDIAITQDSADIIEANNSPGPRIMQAMDRIPKGQKIFPLVKKDILKQSKSKKQKYSIDYSPFINK